MKNLKDTLEVKIGDGISITAPQGVTEKQIADAIRGLVSESSRAELESTRAQNLKDIAKKMNEYIEKTGPINTALRAKRGTIQIDGIQFDGDFCTGTFTSYGQKVGFRVNVNTIAYHPEFEIIVNNKKYVVSMNDMNIMNAAMQFLKDNGSRDIENPFYPNDKDIRLKEKLSINKPKTALRAALSIGKGFIYNPGGVLSISEFTHMLNERALELGILQNKEQ